MTSGPKRKVIERQASAARTASLLVRIKTEYVITPGVTLRALAEKYSVPYQEVWTVARDENWGADRERHVRQIVADSSAMVSSELANVAVNSMRATLSELEAITNAALQRIRRRMESPDDLEVVEDTLEQEYQDKDGRNIRRVARRRRINEESDFVRDLISTRLRILSALVGVDLEQPRVVQSQPGSGSGLITLE